MRIVYILSAARYSGIDKGVYCLNMVNGENFLTASPVGVKSAGLKKVNS